MKKIFSILIPLFTAIALSAAPVSCPMAGNGNKDHEGKKWGDLKKMLQKEVGLTDQQIKQMENARITSEKTNENARHELKLETINIREAAVNGTLTKAKLKESLKKMEENRSKIHAARFQSLVTALDVLTDEQLKKICDSKMLGRLIDLPDSEMGPHGMNKEKMKGMKGCPMMK
ncbi:MAG: hypothetical protein A2293_16470 [Elusimicrobia bacterium RIFOXYB2_FULL_49_7]|nr:MAG: hypothetical protein A2293_16470 [Elusimicrobia bacterium RIFOXYB2_FULL_49_7]